MSVTRSTRPCSPGVGAAGMGPGTTRSRLRSTTCAAISMPPTPSVSVWCSFMMSAARFAGSPSTRVNSHSGRSWSNELSPAARASSSTAAMPPPRCTRTRLRCSDMSKSGSTTQRGGASPNGTVTSFWRNRGTSRVARSMRSHSTSQSGEWSNVATATIVARSNGSRSSVTVNASTGLMWSSSGAPMRESLPSSDRAAEVSKVPTQREWSDAPDDDVIRQVQRLAAQLGNRRGLEQRAAAGRPDDHDLGHLGARPRPPGSRSRSSRARARAGRAERGRGRTGR